MAYKTFHDKIYTKTGSTRRIDRNTALLQSCILLLFHSNWASSWIARIAMRTTANGQLRIAVMPIVEKTWIVLDLDGGLRESAWAKVTPYIAKVEGRYAIERISQYLMNTKEHTRRCNKHSSTCEQGHKQIHSYWRGLIQLDIINKHSLTKSWYDTKNDPQPIELLNLGNIRHTTYESYLCKSQKNEWFYYNSMNCNVEPAAYCI